MAFFSVEADGVPTPGYQWRFNGLPIAGEVSSLLTLANVTSANGGSYDVVVSNGVGAVTSQSANLMVRTEPLTVAGSTILSDGQIQMLVHGIQGRRYRLQYKDELTNPVWSNLPPVTAASDWLNLTDTPSSLPGRFYRVRED
jgi:hypothetical protein